MEVHIQAHFRRHPRLDFHTPVAYVLSLFLSDPATDSK
ncbi:hypothetical protein D3OALGA1CA_126 [Olavius algarvensis associated proteobacterium Delta 3]|nr:hypothetical protein D3OALGA1CA_126 [Olavius algarvensis associated proteobacterium Delta 3]